MPEKGIAGFADLTNWANCGKMDKKETQILSVFDNIILFISPGGFPLKTSSQKLVFLAVLHLVVVPLVIVPLRGGEIEPFFKGRLENLQPGEKVSAIVHMAEKVELNVLTDSLTTQRTSRRVWHESVISELRKKALSTQGPVLAYLLAEKQRGRVEEFVEYWITNAIVVKCDPEVLVELEGRFDVGTIYRDETLHLIEPVPTGVEMPLRTVEIEPGIRAIGAHLLWAQGITGSGRLGCNIDTGVDGTHPALASRWRGLDKGVSPGEAWFDPVTGTDFPFDEGHHGTHTMGTMLGIDTATGDSIGVAPEAKWIAAGVIDRLDIETTIQDALAAFQWAADPDGDPSTVDDVPDVINNSWGISPIYHGVPPCDETFWDAIDGVEAAGVVVIYAAGNEGGLGSMTIRTPADRVTTGVNAFAVGALLEDQVNIAPYSARGPSSCDSLTVKPEIVVQGSNVRSALPGAGYITLSGTSMASPHASGAVLLLRQLAPDATVHDIKEAILLSADDLGPAGEDNDYGSGRLNVYEAAKLLVDFGTVEGYLTDVKTGDPVTGSVLVPGTPLEVITDENGFYSISLLPGAVYQLEVVVFGFAAARLEIEIEAGGVYNADFLLERLPSGTLEGYVCDSSSSVIEDAVVSVLGTPVPAAVTNGSGFYSFEYLPADTYFVIGVTTSGYEPFRCGVDIADGTTIQLNAVLLDGFYDDVEGDYQGWAHYSVSPGYGEEWHNSEQRNHTTGGYLSWKCGARGVGSYSDHLDAVLETPAIQLDGNKDLVLWHWMDVEVYNETLAWDGAVVEMRLNGGQWNLIEPTTGYQYAIHPNSGSPFPSGMPCLSGSHDWEQLRFDLKGVAGTARFRFRFGTNGSAAKEGWYIDDVMLEDWRHLDIVTAVPQDTILTQGDTLRFGAGVVNLSGDSQSFYGKVDVLTDDGFRYPVFGPRKFVTSPYERIEFPDLLIPIPDRAPFMEMTLEMTVVDEGGDVIDTDGFIFTIHGNSIDNTTPLTDRELSF